MTSLDVPHFGARPERESVHMATAHLWKQRSICKRAKVGCLITTSNLRRVVSIGYNGPAISLPHDTCTGKVGKCRCLHAEENAVIALREDRHSLYLFTTVFPCFMCCQRIIQTQAIIKVHYDSCYRDMSEGRRVLHTAHIEMVQLEV